MLLFGNGELLAGHPTAPATDLIPPLTSPSGGRLTKLLDLLQEKSELSYTYPQISGTLVAPSRAPCSDPLGCGLAQPPLRVTLDRPDIRAAPGLQIKRDADWAILPKAIESVCYRAHWTGRWLRPFPLILPARLAMCPSEEEGLVVIRQTVPSAVQCADALPRACVTGYRPPAPTQRLSPDQALRRIAAAGLGGADALSRRGGVVDRPAQSCLSTSSNPRILPVSSLEAGLFVSGRVVRCVTVHCTASPLLCSVKPV